jgi:hypothetical protein
MTELGIVPQPGFGVIAQPVIFNTGNQSQARKLKFKKEKEQEKENYQKMMEQRSQEARIARSI